MSYTPKNWQTLYNLANGAAFGLGHNFRQVGYLRPRQRHARLHNVCFAEASTHPGTGLPIVLLSAFDHGARFEGCRCAASVVSTKAGDGVILARAMCSSGLYPV